MGTDKAFVEVGSRPMVRRVVDALVEAGCSEVTAVGGDRARLLALGLDVVDDRWPGEGPLGGLVTAIEVASSRGADVVLVAGCDLPFLTGRSLADLVTSARGPDIDVALAHSGRDEPLCAAWRVASCGPVLQRAFGTGERAVHRAMAPLRLRRVAVDGSELHNVNRPDDLTGR
jgi:molybdopterin-guanine dinucleotide biosynthesis protein A